MNTCTLPPVEDCIDFAKKNGFTFRAGKIGNQNCGCAITILALMDKEGKQLLLNSIRQPHLVETDLYDWCYSKYGGSTSVWGGFDDAAVGRNLGCDDNLHHYNWAKDLYFAAREANLVV